MQNLPSVAIIGRPNVGKSTLFNRILGIRQAITSREPGTTRDRIVEEVEWGDKKFLLIDTAGFLVDYFGFKEEEIESQAQAQIKDAAEEADLVLFVVDAKSGVLPADIEVGRLLRRFNKKVVLVANKADSLKSEQTVEFEKLGFSEQVCVSAISGRRTGQLLDIVVEHLPKTSRVPEKNLRKIAIVGRPNVGKSTLFNALVGQERSIVSDVAGTTRDSVKFALTKIGAAHQFEIIDTAGFRRRGKIVPGVEKFSAYRTVKSIAEADLVLVVIDASEGIMRQDAHIIQLALDRKKKTIIAMNKIDLLEEKTTEQIKNFYRYPFINRIQSIAISAKNKNNLGLLLKEIMGWGCS